MLAPAPAPACTVMVCRVPAASFLTVSGVAATRVSPGWISVGIPIRIQWALRSKRSDAPRLRARTAIQYMSRGTGSRLDAFEGSLLARTTETLRHRGLFFSVSRCLGVSSQFVPLEKVSHASIVPLSSPRRSHRRDRQDDPCVNDSGTI
jgi:hypothetical protein